MPTTITPNPLKTNRIYKTKKTDTHKTAGEPVTSLNSPAPISGCQEKVIQPCKKWYNMKIVETYIDYNASILIWPNAICTSWCMKMVLKEN